MNGRAAGLWGTTGRVLAALGAVLTLGTAARGDVAGAGAVCEVWPGGIARATHGWAVFPAAQGGVLVHFPPRRTGAADGRAHGAADGTVRKVMDLESMPAAIAAVGERVYLIFEQSTVASEPVRRSVASVVARPSVIGGYWYFEPEGRLSSHPPLPAGGDLRAAAGTGIGLAALIDNEPGAGRGSRLMLLRDERWQDVNLPPEAGAGRMSLLGWRQGIGLLVVSEQGAAEVWLGSVRAPAPSAPESRRAAQPYEEDDEPLLSGFDSDGAAEPLALDWRSSPVAADGSLGLVPRRDFFLIAGHLVYTTPGPKGLVVGAVTRESSYDIARLGEVTGPFAAVPMDAPGRLCITWTAPDEPASERYAPAAKAARMHLEVREISAFTGRVLYSGRGQGDAPVTAGEVQLLAGAMVGLMTVVLLLVLRRDPENGVLHLPEGTALAEPGRRLAASVVDGTIAVVVASRIWEVPASEILVPARMVSGESLWVVGTALTVGLGAGVLLEWLTGRTIGKLLAGCAVVDVRGGAEGQAAHPRAWQALARNAVKWLVPPVAVLGLLDAQGRHRGDSIARTAVVVRVEREGPAAGGADE